MGLVFAAGVGGGAGGGIESNDSESNGADVELRRTMTGRDADFCGKVVAALSLGAAAAKPQKLGTVATAPSVTPVLPAGPALRVDPDKSAAKEEPGVVPPAVPSTSAKAA